MNFRNLKSDEIECRVGTLKNDGSGCSFLLYKDARCDMSILDETVGCMLWKREHTRENANCIVSIWSEKLKQWVGKEDTGKESVAEKAKGLASDSFKRACVNWGIGRELYTSPFIWVKLNADETYKNKSGKMALNNFVKFKVSKISYIENKISGLVIVDNKGNIRFSFGLIIPTKKPVYTSPAKNLKCGKCGNTITEEERTFSMKKRGTYLCTNCMIDHHAEIKKILDSVNLGTYQMGCLTYLKGHKLPNNKTYFEYLKETKKYEQAVMSYLRSEITKIDKDFAAAFSKNSTLKDYADGINSLK